MAKKQIEGQISLFDFISHEEKQKIPKKKHKSTSKESKSCTVDYEVISLYKECINCWCSTCRHNGKGKAIPRDFAGEKKPCPSCNFCLNQEKAEICEINSYENGCKLRAEEEGISMST